MPKKEKLNKKGGVKVEKGHLSPFLGPSMYIDELGEKIAVPDDWVCSNVLKTPLPCPPPPLDPQVVHKYTDQFFVA